MQNLLTVELLFVTVILFIGKAVYAQTFCSLCLILAIPIILQVYCRRLKETGHSLKCYECRSDTDDGCSSRMNISWSKECPKKTNDSKVYCRKIHQQLKFKGEKGWTSIRECAYQKGSSSCYRFKWFSIAHQTICECDHENCNRGRGRVSEILTVAAVFSLTCIFNYLQTNSG